jgi:probable rRNA maturation factor
MPQVEEGRQQEIPGPGRPLRGELFICVDDAVAHARQFRTTWQSELVRYVIHGLLHLCGHDDLQPAARHRMKQEERRLLRQLSQRFPLARLGKPHRSDC